MAQMTPKKHEITEFNNGTGDEYGLQISDASDFTKVVENATYSAKVADSLANSGVDNTEANNVGTAQVEITGTGTAKKFKFKNLKGETGNGISSVSKTGTSGLVDTYTITFTSGATTTFSVANGKGIASITKTGTSGLVDTYTIAFNDSTSTTFTVTNGEKGDKGNTGLTPNLQIGNTTTLETGQPATATISGTTDNPILNLGLPKGNTGSQGIQGKSYVPKGEWSSATAYINNATTIDTVLYLGSTYYCKQSNTNQTPTNTTYWGLLAEKGSDAGVTIVQAIGQSETAIMSQKAVTDAIQTAIPNMLKDPDKTYLVVKIPTDNDTFTLLTSTAGSPNYTIEWGDGFSDNITDTSSPTHTYSKAGMYLITISGSFENGIKVGYSENVNKDKMIEVYGGTNCPTSVSERAFSNCTNLTTATFPNATSISDYAFRDCKNLTTANFPNATSVSTNAFRDCTNLTTATFPNATSISDYAFRNCTSLTTANFPNVTSIGTYTFQLCTNLKNLTLGNVTTTDTGTRFKNVVLDTLTISGTITDTDITRIKTFFTDNGGSFSQSCEIKYGLQVEKTPTLDNDVLRKIDQTATNTTYSNTTSGLTANSVQDAIDEISGMGVERVEVVYDSSSSDSSINWGYTSGITDNMTVSGKDFSKYRYLRCYSQVYAISYMTLIDLTKLNTDNDYTGFDLFWLVQSSTMFGKIETHVNSAKTSMTFRVFYEDFNTGVINSNSDYYFYKIEGVY